MKKDLKKLKKLRMDEIPELMEMKELLVREGKGLEQESFLLASGEPQENAELRCR